MTNVMAWDDGIVSKTMVVVNLLLCGGGLKIKQAVTRDEFSAGNPRVVLCN